MDRAEAGSIGASLVAHLALFGLVALVAGRPSPEPVPPPMEVSFVEGEVGLTSASPVQSPPEQGMAPEAGPTEDAAPTPDRPLPDLRPEPPRPSVAPAEAPPTPRQRAQAQPRERNAPGERTRRSLIGDDILKGIGRDPSTSRSQQAPAAITGEARASINAAIARALRPCQRQTLPAPQAETILVHVSVALNRDGSLASARVARIVNGNPGLAIYERRMQDLALAVVQGCTPIRGLPAQYYDVPRGWRQFNYIFDPRSR